MDLWSPPGLHLESVGEGKLHGNACVTAATMLRKWERSCELCKALSGERGGDASSVFGDNATDLGGCARDKRAS
jgi:hypothetical protein